MRSGRTARTLLAGAFAFALLGAAARALINPLFTPVDLVGQARCVLLVRFGPAEGDRLPLEVVRAIKGEAPEEKLVIDLAAAPARDHGADLKQRAAALPKDTPVLLFMGKFRERKEGEEPGEMEEAQEEEEEPEDEPGGQAPMYQPALLHLPGYWAGLYPAKGGVLELFGSNEHMLGTWHGDGDMLLRAVDYVLNAPQPDVPVRAHAMWVERTKLTTLEGACRGLQAVDLAGDARPELFVLCEAGDRLYRYDPKAKKYVDDSAARKLGSRSACAAWADLDGDKRLDLASWDGVKLVFWLQAEDGAFKPSEPKIKGTLPKEVVGLAALDAGGSTGLVLSPAGAPPVILTPKEGSWAARQLDGLEGVELGRAGPCLVADFDGDAVADVIQPFQNGSFFHKGKGGGAFEAGRKCAVALGENTTGASVGDLDQDGRLDVFVAAPDGFRLWNNRGGGIFLDTWHLTGEPSYIAPRQGAQSGSSLGDLNNDGREDFLAVYARTDEKEVKRYPYIFFNRGFRSFGHAHMLDIDERQDDLEDIAPEAVWGAQAGLLADLNADGAQEMALALARGALWVLRRAAASRDYQAFDETALAVAVSLAPGCAGPVTVTARSEEEERFLGARVAAAGAPAFLGLRQEGAVTLAWRLAPGGAPQKKKVVVVDGLVRVVLGADGAKVFEARAEPGPGAGASPVEAAAPAPTRAAPGATGAAGAAGAAQPAAADAERRPLISLLPVLLAGGVLAAVLVVLWRLVRGREARR